MYNLLNHPCLTINTVKKIACLISNKGTGTNLQAIVDACKAGKIKGKIVVVVSNSTNAFGLERAQKENIPTEIFPWKPYKDSGKSRAAYSKDLAGLLAKKYDPDIVVLAGWILILTQEFVKKFPLTINLHPGLIPDKKGDIVYFPDGLAAFSNEGTHTNNAIKQFLESGCSYAGSTLHVVTENVDWGPVIERAFEKIQPNDTVESLYSRLKKKEHQMLVKSLALLSEEKLIIKGGKVIFSK